ncbi:hypothetical protein LQ327_04200 [Actinomycetospora endophytica]|uniref:Uncharacterized protein n=1 Tax=Actinomycetospora endophytica TaxID=2291215 RepID=A0ABS8P4W5_9PSEU|nr:hypothetical protein [Actinomycetospora endophytica]MCD2192590.1 hypothetical protein [Actinomycetospora endophytica]
MTDARDTAEKALRDATAALTSGIEANRGADPIAPAEAAELAYYIAETLDTVVALLDTVDLRPAPKTSTEQTLEGAARHVHEAAGLAHVAAQRYKPHRRPTWDGGSTG